MGSQHTKGIHFADMNPFRAFRLETAYQPSESLLHELPLEVETTSSFEKWLTTNPELKEVRYNFVSDEADEEGLRVKLEAPAVTTATAKSSLIKEEVMRFQLIGGAFAVKENADQFLADLRQKGYPAVSAGKKGNLFLVAYGTYATENEARSAMKAIKQSGSSSVWLKR
jgi:cell division protein FtsN